MKKLILASASAIALFGVAACRENKDSTTTQSVKPPATGQMAPADPKASPPATDKMTTQGVETPQTGDRVHKTEPTPAKPAPSAPAQ